MGTAFGCHGAPLFFLTQEEPQSSFGEGEVYPGEGLGFWCHTQEAQRRVYPGRAYENGREEAGAEEESAGGWEAKRARPDSVERLLRALAKLRLSRRAAGPQFSMDWERWFSVLGHVHKTGRIHGHRIVSNTSQCRHLASVCFSKLQDLRANATAFNEIGHFLKEVDFILQRIESFFDACSEMKWLGYLITDLDSQEAYLVHLHDILCCMATLDAALHHSKGFSFAEMLIQKMRECDEVLCSPDLSQHVLLDRADMVKLLRSMQNIHGCCFCFGKQQKLNKCHIASFLAGKCAGRTLVVAPQETPPAEFEILPNAISRLDSSCIGEGSSGIVYEGTWLGQRVAVKEFLTKHPNFVKEAAMHASLRSPFIVQLIGWSAADEEKNSLVMELMSGSLDTYMASRPKLDSSASLEVAVDIMLQISRGMEYLHKMKVIHRDLKPSNVLVNPCKHKEGNVRIKLTDFGAAKVKLDSTFYSTEKQGTAYYRAPEILACHKYTLKADIFSFAILSYEILAEEAPNCFLNASTKELYTRVTNNVRPKLPSSCPPILSDCIKKCWDSEPDHRPSFAEISKMLRYVKSLLLGLRSFSIAELSVSITAILMDNPQDVSFLLDEVVEN